MKHLPFFTTAFAAATWLPLSLGCAQDAEKPMTSASSQTSEGTRAGGEEAAAPQAEDTREIGFAAGDPFRYAVVRTRSQMVEAMLAGAHYASALSHKAVAVNAKGLGFASVREEATQPEVEQIALEGCFYFGGGKPCGLLAKGNVFAVGEAQLEPSLRFEMAGASDLRSVPFVTPAEARKLAADYTAMSAPYKAAAISADGTVVVVPKPSDPAVASQDEANLTALERCELSSTLSPCALFASGARVVFSSDITTAKRSIEYGGRLLGNRIPAMLSATFDRDVRPNQLGSIYLSASGDGASNPDGPRARFECEQRAGTPCFPYGHQGLVQLNAADRAAMKASAEIHCRAVPRRTCADHAAMGCGLSGGFYTTESGHVTLESCETSRGW